MRSTLMSVMLLILVLATSRTIVDAARSCKASGLEISSVKPKVQFSKELRNLDEGLKRVFQVNLTTGNKQGIGFDGYLVRLRTPTSEVSSIVPTDHCRSREDYFWIQTTNTTECRWTTNFTGCLTNTSSSLSEYCPCAKHNCLRAVNLPCLDVADLMDHRHGKFYSIPKSVGFAEFEIEFHRYYHFEAYMYYRQYLSKRTPKSVVPDVTCTDAVSKQLQVGIDQARNKCCESGAISALPYGVQQTKVIPIFEEGNATTVNVTITWFPPDVNPNASINIILRPFLSNKIINVKKRVPDSSEDYNSTNCSSRPPYYYETLFYDLEVGPSYEVDIHASYEGNICDNGLCTTTFSLNAKVPEDLCQEEFQYCVAQAVCSNSNASNLTPICDCNEGYIGDGRARGTGCEDLDMCDSLADNICAPGSICTDLPPPSLGMTCACPDGFYGDGLRDGSGCDSNVTLLLAILLPSLFVLILAVIVAVFLIRKRSQARKNEQLQRFITDLYAEEGILTYYQDPDAVSNKQQSWQPTFGKEWELDRNDIQFEDVLGRGNYGIVYKGHLASESRVNGGGRSRETGEFYNLVKTSDTYGNVDSHSSDDGTTLVAVKCLQESIHSHENLLNFLAEISFMLNLRDHDNIVKVHGCSTTESPVFMVMEYMCYGNLLHFLWDAREPSKRESDPVYNVTELSLSTMVKDVAQGMVYLQQIRVIHGDIAARNILVGENGKCKLSDFGLSSDVYRYGHIKQGIREITVPLKWTSPERMMNGRYPITYKSDVWSYGNLLYEVFTLGCTPYPQVQASDLLEFLKLGIRMGKPNSCSDEMYELMTKCWRWRASSRPSFIQVLSSLENIVNTIKSQKQTPPVLAVEDLDKELYEQELIAARELGNTKSDGSLPHYENIHAAESEL